MQTSHDKKTRKNRLDPIRVNQLTQQGHLKWLIEKANRLKKLHHTIIPLLPEALRPHCQVVNYEQQQLIIQTSSSTYATLLRYQKQALLKQLAQHKIGVFFTDIDIAVRPPN